jgi:signal peptidase I
MANRMITATEKRVSKFDIVETKSGRRGVVGWISHEVAHVYWDDHNDFQIKVCHLKVIAHGGQLPDRAKKAKASPRPLFDHQRHIDTP